MMIFACLLFLTCCATHKTQKVGPTQIFQAQEEFPEEQLLDVGVAVFTSEELNEKEAENQGTHPDVRNAETHFIAYHLKNTLQQSSHWGAVRVVPVEAEGLEVVVKGEIVESNGESLVLVVDVIDATGNIWLQKKYEAKASEEAYANNIPGEKDAFQDLYNTLANDMAYYKSKVSDDNIAKIRSAAKLRFAQDFAPDAFKDYVTKGEEGTYTINRLPADDDPLMERLLRIREREHMYVDVLNENYDEFYNEMWPPYEDWRRLSLQEQTALREIRRDAFLRQAGGVLMLALAIALDLGDAQGTQSLQNILILSGGAVFIDGINVSKQAEIHSAAIQELSESFGNEMKPVVVEFEGKQYELSGSAEEQYKRWRELLRQIYYAETGLGPEPPPHEPAADNLETQNVQPPSGTSPEPNL